MIKHAEPPKPERVSTKKEWIIIGILLFILLVVGGAALFSSYAWQKYENNFTAWHKDLREQADQALKLPSKTLADRAEKLTTLRSLQQTASEGVNHCNAYKSLHWQQGIDAVKQKLTSCRQLAGPAEQFASDLQVVTDHLMAEKTVAGIFVDVKLGDQIDEARWPELTNHWAKITKQLQAQKPPTTFIPTQKLAIEKANMATGAWKSLVDANTAKDRVKYEAATQNLTMAYDGLAEIGGSAEKALLPLLEKVQKSYEQVLSRSNL